MANRSDRFSTLLPIAEFCNSHALIIGCGSIGAVIARTLCAMGVTNFTLVDPDTISHENLGTQGWRPGHLALPKVDALRTELLELNPLISCFTSTGKAPPIPDPPSGSLIPDYSVLFLCVDSIDARKSIYTSTFDFLLPTVDSRMTAETARTVFVPPNRTASTSYLASLPPPDPEGTPAIPCTAKSTLYCAQLAASLAIHRWTQHLRDSSTPFSDTTFHLPSLCFYPS